MIIIDHGGAVAGYSAQLSFEKRSKYGVIIMRNYNFGATDFFARSNILLRDLTKLETRSKKGLGRGTATKSVK
jgi:hypothetical protein